ncbi:MAG: hypothetical protein NZ455_02770 [Bacteroidia bacterium]|nr:hypothetical protein [Bacteroidia bacterium]MDW8348403.1 hypothetical protein [Bacteroidia bacterium]
MSIDERTQIAFELLQNILSDKPEYFIVEVKVRPFRNGYIVLAYIDTDLGISLEQCSYISTLYEKVLEGSPVFKQLYRLDVSSPGLDRPLLPRQFARNVGRKMEVKISAEEIYTGKLVSTREEDFTLEISGDKKKKVPLTQKTFMYSEIESAKIIL